MHRNWIDRYPHGQLEQTLSELGDSPMELNWYALLDLGFCTEREWRKTGVAAGSALLYSRYGSGRLENLSPALHPLPRDESRHALLRKLFDLSDGRPMLSLIASMDPLDVLARQLQRRLEVQTQDARVYLVRFSDTRCLPTWVQALDGPQRSRFLAGVRAWKYADRMGVMASLPMEARTEERIDDALPCSLGPGQHARLCQAALPDTVLEYLRQRPVQFGALSGLPSEVHACIAATLAESGEEDGNVSADTYRHLLARLRQDGLLQAPRAAAPMAEGFMTETHDAV